MSAMAKTDHYDVALSFAGEDQQFAEELFNALQQRGIRVFYSNNEQADLWGKNLYDYLSDLYSNRAKYCVVLISTHYVQKMWTNLERQAVQAKALKLNEEYILPIKLDNSDLRGMTDSIAFILWPPEDAQTISEKIAYKLNASNPSRSVTPTIQPNNQTNEKLIFQPELGSLMEVDAKKARRDWRIYSISEKLVLYPWYASAIFLLIGILIKADGAFAISGIGMLATLVGLLVTSPFSKKYEYVAGLFPYEDVTKMGKYMRDGKFAKATDDGKYQIYKMTVKCVFPDCDGPVYITDPPTEDKKYFSAQCSLDKFVHKYKVESTGVATKIVEK